MASTGVLPRIGGNADVMELNFTRPETVDVVLVIQASSDLVSWSDISILPANGTVWGGSAVVNESQNAGTRTVNVHYTPPSQPAPVFYLRLAARRN